jgi:transposase
VRLLSTGHGRKSDEADALSVGIAAWSAPELHTIAVDQQIAVLRALTEHRDDLVRTRTQTVNRLHALLVKLIPSDLPRGHTAAAAQRGTRPRSDLGRTVRTLAVELVAEVRRLDHRVTNTTKRLADAVARSGSTLTALHGVGDVVAAKLLARTGPIQRFRSPAAFASFCGVAPIEVSSGEVQTPPTLPRRRPATQLRAACHGDHPDPVRLARKVLLPAQTRSREEPQGSAALPQTPAFRHCLPHHHPGLGFLTVASDLTQRGADHGRPRQ